MGFDRQDLMFLFFFLSFFFFFCLLVEGDAALLDAAKKGNLTRVSCKLKCLWMKCDCNNYLFLSDICATLPSAGDEAFHTRKHKLSRHTRTKLHSFASGRSVENFS